MNRIKAGSFWVAIFAATLTFAQENPIPADKHIYPVGRVTRTELQQGAFGRYFMEEYRAYEPCRNTLSKLKDHIYQYSIVIVLGTWCSDSQEQVPRLYKILDNLDYKTSGIKNICVDKNKTGGDFDISNLQIERVPTFIFYKGENEIGRIIETPVKTLEEDMNALLTK